MKLQSTLVPDDAFLILLLIRRFDLLNACLALPYILPAYVVEAGSGLDRLTMRFISFCTRSLESSDAAMGATCPPVYP
eukprot:CAMPEP_0178649504 /NCGR_PEP_ID=MMETSP0698-20121128/21056_1 /TAXON_ID=265572 /ORGANISM="Extubocellulus spinifer, Strain CCMP396" /LENGTH=77 /DNA_ID=CAMNT_0020290957 /DNA_START=37 /DNA_END=266 /DNA_ORIENTATION=-